MLWWRGKSVPRAFLTEYDVLGCEAQGHLKARAQWRQHACERA
jgi:hypothetical protein